MISVEADAARVDLDGRIRRAATWLVPDVVPGEWVEVAAGTILRRVTAAEAAELTALLRGPAADPILEGGAP